MNIEIFSSPGCGKCGHAKTRLQRLVEELSARGVAELHWREVDILQEMDYAVGLGVLSTPSLAIDGELVFTSLPSEKRLRREIEDRLSASGARSA